MYTIFSRSTRHFIIRAACLVLFLFLFLNCFTANAQRFFRDYDEEPGNGVGINLALDAPVGNLQYTYKPAINYNLNYYRFFDHATATIGIGYRTYKPKQDVFYYAVGDNDYGTAGYSDFRSYMGYMGAAYNIDITDGVKAYGGFNLGFYMTKFSSHSEDAFMNNREQVDGEQQAYFAPKLGATIDIGDNLQLNIQGAYSIFSPIGKKEEYSRVGTIYSSFNIGSGIAFKF